MKTIVPTSWFPHLKVRDQRSGFQMVYSSLGHFRVREEDEERLWVLALFQRDFLPGLYGGIDIFSPQIFARILQSIGLDELYSLGSKFFYSCMPVIFLMKS